LGDPPTELLQGLNAEQADAVTHGEGPLLVLAGAGSGKTRVLTRRLAWLVAHGVPPEAIVAVTFTNKAAGEMKERVAALLGSLKLARTGALDTERPRSFVGTFHAWGVRLLRRFAAEAGVPRSFVVFDQDDQLVVVKRAMKELALPEKFATPRSLLAKISAAKNSGLPPAELARRFGEALGSRLADLWRAYEKALAASSALDFDDLLVRSERLLSTHADVHALVSRSVRHLLVDEYQDTNRIQARLVKLVAGEAGNVFVVGDEDQSIYRWRGADVGNILDFAKEFRGARTVRLEQNYRSAPAILEAAGAVVAENRRRLGKTLRPTRRGGEKVRLLSFDEERDEAREVVSRLVAARRKDAARKEAVLFRTNAQSRPFEDELLRANVPYLLVGGTKFYERAEVKDALAYLRLLKNPDDDVSFRRVVNVPARGIGAATLEALEAAAAEKGTSLFGALAVLPPQMSERAKKALGEFRSLVEEIRESAANPAAGAAAAVAAVLRQTGLVALYEKSADPEDEARRENLDELLAAAREHERASAGGGEGEDPTLSGFLDAVTLRSDADEADERKGVLLITLHAAKGLEFDDVFLVGMEDGSLPHISSQSDEEEVEEERRLAYVGMTRAKDRLTLSLVRRRMVRGEWVSRDPSPFLDAIPESALVREDFGTFGSGSFRGAGGLGFPRAPQLFPDYENESQDAVPVRHVAARRPATAIPRMRRTPPPPTASGFRRGSRVVHPEYGPGVVLTIEGSGDDEKLTVYFDRAGRKKFVARFANLSPV
jgi:DNA helicase-2/ATP-dependent DNA helicase PcrA